MSRLNIALFGDFRLSGSNGTEIPVAGKKLRGLIAYLALNPGRRIGRQTLANMLWGGRFDAQARQSLRQALHQLHRIVDAHQPDVLLSSDDAVELDAAHYDVDVRSFEEAHHSSDLGSAVEIYRGHLLEGLRVRSDPFDAWLAGERTRL